MRRVVFLTPNLPPLVCGLADHSRLLAAALARVGCEIGVIGLHGVPAGAACSERSLGVEKWDGRPTSLAALVDRLAPDWLWVQLSGYGYSRWGAPWQLGQALRAVKARSRAVRLAICVHETHCQPRQLGPKGALLSPWQRFTVGRIVRLGDLILPTISLSEQQCLHEYHVDSTRLLRLPIAANVPPVHLSKAERTEHREAVGIGVDERVAVIFGTSPSQRVAFERLGPAVQAAFAAGQIDRLIVVGGESAEQPPWLVRLAAAPSWAGKIRRFGRQPAARVSELLAIADVGLVPTAWPMWQRSGAARAFEQAGLTLWIWDPPDHRVVPPSPHPPKWDELAKTVVERLEARGRG